jgi:hypothetical protein
MYSTRWTNEDHAASIVGGGPLMWPEIAYHVGFVVTLLESFLDVSKGKRFT